MSKTINFDPNSYEILAQAAESIIYHKDDVVVKKRIKKGYRISFIDDKLRKSRTKREAKVLKKIEDLNLSPKLIKVDEKDKIIFMEYVKGSKLVDCYKSEYAKEIGQIIAKIHNLDIIHGDLTTSNIILDENNQLKLIDFGLSITSKKSEDKAVDLKLVFEAIKSKHNELYEVSRENIIKGYQEISNNSKAILKRLEIVEARGRNKH